MTGIPPEAREAARAAASREGLSVGDWLTRKILGEVPIQPEPEPVPSSSSSAPREYSPLSFRRERDDDMRYGREDLAVRLARAEAETDSAFRRIDDTLRAMTRRLETAERSQNEAHRAMGVAAAEINQAARDQATAFNALAERIERVERSADSGALKDAVRGLHQGLSRLADQIARTANESSTQVASLAANVETVAGQVNETREEASRTGQSLDARVAVLSDRVKAAEDASVGTTNALRTALGLFESRLAAAEPKAAEIERSTQSIVALEKTMELVTQRLAAAETRAAASENKAEDAVAKQLSAIEKSLAAIVTRLDANDKQQRDALAELKAGLAETNKRVDKLAAPAPEAVVAAPILDMPPFEPPPAPVMSPVMSPIASSAMPQATAAPMPPAPQPEFAAPPPFEPVAPSAYAAEAPTPFAAAPAAFVTEPPAAAAPPNYLSAARRAAQAAAEAEPVQANHSTLGSFRGWTESDTRGGGMGRTALIGAIVLLVIIAALAGVLFMRGMVRGSSEQAQTTTQVGQMFSQSRQQNQQAAPAEGAGNANLPPRPLTRSETQQYFGSAASSLQESQHQEVSPSTSETEAIHAPPTTAAPAAKGLPRQASANAVPNAAAPPTALSAQPGSMAALLARAKAGDPKAELVLGFKYLDGDGVTASDSDAVNWLTRAANAGNAVAQYRLGTLYERGRGVPADPKLAHQWYEKAARGGNRKAMHNLAVSFAQGTGVDKDYKQAARWFSAAAALGLLDSQFNLAVLYERGLGVAPSLRDAYKWYAIAAAQGDAESKSRLDALATQLTPEDKAAAEKDAGQFRMQPINHDANDVPDMAQVAQ